MSIGRAGSGDPRGDPKELAGAGEWAATALRTEVHLDQEGKWASIRRADGKEDEGSNALGLGSPNRQLGRRRGLPEPLAVGDGNTGISELSGLWQPRQPAALGSINTGAEKEESECAFGVQVLVLISLGVISAFLYVLLEQKREEWITGKVGHFP